METLKKNIYIYVMKMSPLTMWRRINGNNPENQNEANNRAVSTNNVEAN